MATETFSRAELMKFIRVGEERTINKYLKKGILPPPEIIGGDEFWNKEKVLSLLGLHHNPNEPFLVPNEVCKILNIEKVNLHWYTKDHSIPCYKLFSGKGVRTLYLKSELDKYLELKIQWRAEWANDALRIKFTTDMIQHLFGIEDMSGAGTDNLFILSEILIKRKNFSQIGREQSKSPDTIFNKYTDSVSNVLRRIEAFNKDVATIKTLQQYNAELIRENRMLKTLNEYEEKGLKPIKEITQTPSVRVNNLLMKIGAETAQHLSMFKLSDIKKHRNVGAKSVTEMTEILEAHGLTWKPETLKKKKI